ncbi:MAG: DUF2142 domain-containing protein, partial [Mycobacteriales bacterium]
MGAHATGRAPPRWKLLAAATVVATPLVVFWSLATPLMAAPDEPAQLVTAAAAARGELFPRTVTSALGVQYSVLLPFGLATVSAIPICFAFQPDVPASCAPAPSTSRRPTAATTQFGNYPPLYYLAVGLATLGGSGPAQLWGARAVSDWLVILLLGVAGYLLRRYHPRRAMLVGLAVAVTPQVLFLGSVVGDSGLEISAALATWAGLMCIADRADPPPAPLVWLTAAAAAVL